MLRQLMFVMLGLLPAGVALADDVTQFSLENGMDVVVIEDHRAPVVVQMVWYKVGAADEKDGQSGVAHFLEHLMFKGTDKIGPGQFSRIVADNGGGDNAFTTWDYTGYYQRVAADRLDLMMEMEADRMVNLILTDAETTPERAVVLEERNQRTETDPGSLFREQRMAAQYLNHPYGRPVIGWRHEIEALTTEDALDWYRRYYAPNNAILIVAGDVTPDQVRELAEKHYGPIPANPDLPARERPSEPPQLAARHLTYEDPRVAQPYVSRTYLAPERDSGAQAEAAALTYLADLLGDNAATSYLGRKLQFEKQTALYTAAYYSGVSLDDTTFSLVMVPAPGLSLADAEKALDDTLAEFLEDGVDAEQFERLKRQYAASAIFQQDSAQGQAEKYGAALTSGLTVKDVQEWPQIIQQVTPDQVMAAAHKLFDMRNSVTGYMTAPQVAAEGVGQ
jgi:zinc protease